MKHIYDVHGQEYHKEPNYQEFGGECKRVFIGNVHRRAYRKQVRKEKRSAANVVQKIVDAGKNRPKKTGNDKREQCRVRNKEHGIIKRRIKKQVKEELRGIDKRYRVIGNKFAADGHIEYHEQQQKRQLHAAAVKSAPTIIRYICKQKQVDAYKRPRNIGAEALFKIETDAENDERKNGVDRDKSGSFVVDKACQFRAQSVKSVCENRADTVFHRFFLLCQTVCSSATPRCFLRL